MDTGRLLVGSVLSLIGLAIFFVDTGFGFAGPQLPTTALGVVGWVFVLAGMGLLKLGASG